MISSSIDDRWHRLDKVTGELVQTSRYGAGKRYRARYWLTGRTGGRQWSKHFSTKREAKEWLQSESSKHQTGRWVEPAKANITVGEWCDKWLEGYKSRKASTYRQAVTQTNVIRATFEDVPLKMVKQSDIRGWVASLQDEGRAESYIYAIYRRFVQITLDAIEDGYLTRSPFSRKTAPSQGQQRPYVATSAQVWALHDAFPENLQPAVLLAAFAGLRLAECAGLRASDVDFNAGVVLPVVQYPCEPLKTDYSRTPIPIPLDLTERLKAAVEAGAGEYVVTDELGRQATPWAIQRAMRDARLKVEGLPAEFRFHDLRHYYASMLIAAGLDVKAVQHRVRHKNATTTLNTYGHMFPDTDEAARSAVAAAMTRTAS